MKEISNVVKIVLLAACVVVFYLLALGFRYERINNDGVVLDKWTMRTYVPQTEEMPVIRNGKTHINYD